VLSKTVTVEQVSEFPQELKPTSKYRSFFDQTLETIAKQKGIERQNPTKEEIDYMTKFINCELEHADFEVLIKRFGEKTIIVNCFGGIKTDFEEHRIALKTINEDMEYAKQHDRTNLYSPEQGKEIHDRKTGDHSPTHATHFNKSLGDDAGWVSFSRRGYVWELSADGIIQQLDIQKTQQMILELYHKVIPAHEAKEITDQINKNMKYYLANALQGTVGDSRTAKQGITIVTKAGQKKHWSFEKTNTVGMEVRNLCEKLDKDFGKLVAEAKVNGTTEKTEEKLARTIVNVANELNMNGDNFFSLIEKLWKRK